MHIKYNKVNKMNYKSVKRPEGLQGGVHLEAFSGIRGKHANDTGGIVLCRAWVLFFVASFLESKTFWFKF